MALDIEDAGALAEYLRATGRLELDETPSCTRLSGGVSNRAMLVERVSGEAWVVKQALERLRVPVEWFSEPERAHREALGIRWLGELAPPGYIPELLFEDRAHHLVAMEAVKQPHENWKTLLMAGTLESAHVEQFGRLLGTIHRNGFEERHRLPELFRDRSVFESLRVEPYYRFTASRVPAVARFLLGVVEEMQARQITIVHGDYSPKNVLVHGGRLVLVDHEAIHLGDPAMDLGFSLTHLLSKANHLEHRRADFAEAAVTYWEAYRATVGEVEWLEGLEERAVRQALACLMARVAGRSTLEYLDEVQRSRQLAAAAAVAASPPSRIEDVVAAFLGRL